MKNKKMFILTIVVFVVTSWACQSVFAGRITAWGHDGNNQVTNTPAGSGYTAIAGGGYHSLALIYTIEDDLCTEAITVQQDNPYNGSTMGATGTNTSSCSFNDTFDVWHSFTTQPTAEYTISLCGSAFDTTLAVFDECGGTELACNDDTQQGICPLKTASQLTISLVGDSTYFIRVAGYDGQTGDYILTITGPICTQEILGDLNDDCKVDFGDLAIMSSSWLDCNLDPPSACWE